jgi:hypothetical protein
MCKTLVGKSEGKRPLRSTVCVDGDNIKTNLMEMGFEDVYWIYVAQARPAAGSCKNGNEPSVPQEAGIFLAS